MSQGRRSWIRRPSPAMVVALIALVFAMSGTAVAATHLVSGDSLIKKQTLSGSRLRNHTLTGAQINLGLLGKVPSAALADKASSLPTLTWTNLTLQNGWTQYGNAADYGTPSFAKDAEGFVHLSGALYGGASTGSIATLPSGFRPTRYNNTWLRAASTNADGQPHLVDINIEASTGNIIAFPATGSTMFFVSLAGLSFYAGP